MQLLTFSVAGQDYAVESRRVIEVLPLVPARPIPRTPDYLVGVFNYRGRLVPLVDLGLRLAGRGLEQRLSTRVIVVEPAAKLAHGASTPLRLGLVAENVVSICGAEQADAALPPLALEDAPYLGRMLRIRGRIIQTLDVDRILPAELAAALLAGVATLPEDAA